MLVLVERLRLLLERSDYVVRTTAMIWPGIVFFKRLWSSPDFPYRIKHGELTNVTVSFNRCEMF